MTTEKPCSTHPDAPHGFVRNASHSVGHYVCECSGWTPPASIQEELRSVPERSRTTLEAADRIDALENEMARIRELWEADQIESSEQRTQIHQLRAQVETLTKDAARYHWLREHTMPKPLPMVRVQVMYQGQYILRDGPELDADVDNRIAAIAAQKAQIK